MFIRSRNGVLGSIDSVVERSKELPSTSSPLRQRGNDPRRLAGVEVRRAGDADWTVFGAGYDKFAAFRGQIETSLASSAARKSLVVTPEDALASVQVIEAAYSLAVSARGA